MSELYGETHRELHDRFDTHSRFVPKSGILTPVPSWKTSEWAADVIPEIDPARDPKREVL